MTGAAADPRKTSGGGTEAGGAVAAEVSVDSNGVGTEAGGAVAAEAAVGVNTNEDGTDALLFVAVPPNGFEQILRDRLSFDHNDGAGAPGWIPVLVHEARGCVPVQTFLFSPFFRL
jgi:hypothetical protein